MSPNQTKEICLFVPDAQTGRFLFNAESLEALGINPVEAQQRGYPMKEQTAFADFISIDDCAQFFPWDRGLGDNIGVGPIPAAAPSPDTPRAARIIRAYKLRQQLVETLGGWIARGSFLWRVRPIEGVALG
jgi:hypothetical protein